MNINNLIIGGFILNVTCGFGVVVANVSNNVNSQNRIKERRQGLTTIAKHVKSQSCWNNSQTEPFKINDEIVLSGSDTGLIPTGCIKATKTKQYLLVAYKGSVLRVQEIYSQREIVNQLSMKETKND